MPERTPRQLAELTQTVGKMTAQMKALQKRFDTQERRAEAQYERSDIQQGRIDLAARELTEVGDRLQAAANALRESV